MCQYPRFYFKCDEWGQGGPVEWSAGPKARGKQCNEPKGMFGYPGQWCKDYCPKHEELRRQYDARDVLRRDTTDHGLPSASPWAAYLRLIGELKDRKYYEQNQHLPNPWLSAVSREDEIRITEQILSQQPTKTIAEGDFKDETWAMFKQRKGGVTIGPNVPRHLQEEIKRFKVGPPPDEHEDRDRPVKRLEKRAQRTQTVRQGTTPSSAFSTGPSAPSFPTVSAFRSPSPGFINPTMLAQAPTHMIEAPSFSPSSHPPKPPSRVASPAISKISMTGSDRARSRSPMPQSRASTPQVDDRSPFALAHGNVLDGISTVTGQSINVDRVAPGSQYNPSGRTTSGDQSSRGDQSRNGRRSARGAQGGRGARGGYGRGRRSGF